MSRSHVVVLSCILLALFTVSQPTVGQGNDTVRVFAPVSPKARDNIKQLIEEHILGVEVVVDGPDLLFGVELERISIPELAERIQAGMYDVVVMSAAANYFIRQGLLLDLDPYVARAGFTNPLLDSMRVKGRLYDLPLFIDPEVVVFNRNIFDHHGLPYPAPGWTWDQFAEVVTRTSNSRVAEPIHGATLSVSSLWPSILYQSNTELLEIDDETLSYSMSIIAQVLLGDTLVHDSYGTSPRFRHGEEAMLVTTLTQALLQHHAFRYAQTGLEWGIAPLPTVPGVEGVNELPGLQTIGIATNTRVALAAWEVAKVLAVDGGHLLDSSLPQLSAYAAQRDIDAWVDQVLPGAMESTRAELRTLLKRKHAFLGRGNMEANQLMVREMNVQLQLLLEGAIAEQQALDALRMHRDALRDES